MSPLEANITKHFAGLGHAIDIRLYSKPATLPYTHCIYGGGGLRLVRLINKYFGWHYRVQNNRVLVRLTTFKAEGYADVTNICKKCGCADLDACVNAAGSSCWWVQDDLCSHCATKKERKTALKQKLTNRQQTSKILQDLPSKKFYFSEA